MSAELFGNLTGRLIVSYLVVWTLMWVAIAGRDWRGAFRRVHRWYGVLAVLMIFSLGLFTTTSRITSV